MKKVLSFFGLFFLALLMVFSLEACGGGGGGSSSGGGGGNGGTLARANITGTVKSGGVGVSGASVSLKDAKGFAYWNGTTDASGNFSGSTGPNENVTSTFTATKAGYGIYNQSVTISPGGSYNFNATI